jgi:hypothetical protein
VTVRRFNYTGRQRITRDRVHLAILRGETCPELTAKVDLDGLDFAPTDRVVIEVHLQSVLERIEMGSAAAPKSLVAIPLRRFTEIDGLRCRVKVIATEEPGAGMIRGIADHLRPRGDATDEQAGRSLLPFVPDATLGQRVWRLDTSEDSPIVRVNPMGGDWRTIVREPRFAQLVMPELLDGIVRWVASMRLGDEEDGPIADWVAFVDALGVDSDALVQGAGAEEVDLVVEEVVSRFCARFGFADALAKGFAEEDR